MNTKTIITICLIALFILFSCKEKTQGISLESQQTSSSENVDGSITIQGRVTIKGTEKVPLGVTTMNVKNKWKFTKDLTKPLEVKRTIALGENQRIFVNKDGYYRITIEKNDTLALIPTPYLYKQPKYITGLTKNQILNIELENLPLQGVLDFEKRNPTAYKVFYNYLKNVNPDSLVNVSGTIYKANTTTPLENIYIVTSFLNNTNGAGNHHLTNKYGQFNLITPKNSHITINGISSNNISFMPKTDTIVNLHL